MKILFAIPVVLGMSFGLSGAALAQGTGGFSYQKAWWPQAVTSPVHGSIGSGAAYAYAGPSGLDLWNDPRAWWPDYHPEAGAMSQPSYPASTHNGTRNYKGHGR
jgi:hypothetical protein